MEKIESIGLVLYNPETLSNLTLEALMDKNKDLHIFIYLNSILKTKVQTEIENLKNKYNNIIVLGNEINNGLSKSFNIICNYALELKMNNVLLIDQDTIIYENEFTNFKIPISNFDNVVCMNLISGKSHNLQLKKNQGFIINNGNIIFLKNFKDVGFFNELYFVELVDYELQFRIKKMGYSYYLVNGSGIFNHISNQGFNVINFLGFNLKLKLYSKSRIIEYFKSSIMLLKNLLYNLQLYPFLQLLYQSIIQMLIISTHKFLWKIYK
jgi:GT2 family glycosyltransferase